MIVYIYMSVCVYVCMYWVPPIRCKRRAAEKTRKKRKRGSFSKEPLGYGLQGASLWEDLSAYFTALRFLEIDVLLAYFILPFWRWLRYDVAICCHTTRTPNMSGAGVHAVLTQGETKTGATHVR